MKKYLEFHCKRSCYFLLYVNFSLKEFKVKSDSVIKRKLIIEIFLQKISNFKGRVSYDVPY